MNKNLLLNLSLLTLLSSSTLAFKAGGAADVMSFSPVATTMEVSKGGYLVLEGTSKVTGNSMLALKEMFESSSKKNEEGQSVSSESISNIFASVSSSFERNREEIEQAVEQRDNDTLAGVRDMIRSQIALELENGEELANSIPDKSIDIFIETKLLEK
jgi:hypothetical protein